MNSWIAVSLLAGILLMAPRMLWAEAFADIAAGGAITQHANVTIQASTVRAKPPSAVSVGGRLGYWFESTPVFGLAGSVSYYSPGRNVVPLSLLLMARVPVLTSEEFPNGQLQPYLGVGPGVFIFDTAADVGMDVRAGMSWLFTPHIGLFGEYRLTAVSTTSNVEVMGQQAQEDISLYTHYFLAGLAYHF